MGWDGMRGIFWEDITGSAANGRFTTYPDREKMHTCGVTKEEERRRRSARGGRQRTSAMQESKISFIFKGSVW